MRTTSPPRYLIKQCSDPGCRFRFPAVQDTKPDSRCPLCGRPGVQEVESFENQQARSAEDVPKRFRLTGILDNLRSAYNVGSIFRTASGVGFDHLYLCGITPTPNHSGVIKTSLGAEEYTPWSHHNNALDIVEELQERAFRLVVLENGPHAQWFSEFAPIPGTERIAIVVGNELSGVDPAIIRACDQHLALPMVGNKTSLNVTVAFGIAAYFLSFVYAQILPE